MLRRLDELFGADAKSRWRILSTSALTIAVVGFALEVAREPVQHAQVIASLSGTCVFLAQIAAYCLRRSTNDVVPERSWQANTLNFIPRRVATAALAAFVFVILDLTAGRQAEAAVLNRRLWLSSRNLPLSPEHAEVIAYCLRAASQGRVALSPKTLTEVRDAIKTSALQNPTSVSIPQAANALVTYSREVQPGPVRAIGNHPRTEAEVAFEAGNQYFVRLITEFPKPIDRAEAQAAKSAFTHAIESAGDNVTLRARSYFLRALAENQLGEYQEALDDVAACETLGVLDMSEVIGVEAMALVGRGRPEDLPRAINLLTLEMQLPPPGLMTHDAEDERLYRIRVLMQRAEAYYRLGQFENAVQDCRTALGLLNFPSRGAAVIYLYKTIILSYLQSGSLENAVAANSEFVQRTGNYPLASETMYLLKTYQLVEPYRSGGPDPKRAVTAVESLWRTLGY